jgi:hypothetical protein
VDQAYAVIPSEETSPVALFSELEAAIEWGLGRYGSDAFVICARTVRWAHDGRRSTDAS